MGSEQATIIISQFATALFLPHAIFRFYVYARSRAKIDLYFSLVIINLTYQVFYYYLFYSGITDKYIWLRGTEVINLYLLANSYSLYINTLLTGKSEVRYRNNFINLVLIVHALVMACHIFLFPENFARLWNDYTKTSIPEVFPSIHYASFQLIVLILMEISFLQTMIKMNSGNAFSIKEVVKLFKSENSMIRYHAFSISFGWVAQMSYYGCYFLGGRDWAVLYTSGEIIVWIINIVIHQISPILAKAGLIRLRPQVAVFTPDEISGIRKNLVLQLEYNQRYLDPDLTLKELSSKMELGTKYFSQFLNTIMNTNFKNLVSDYRVNHACEILRNDHERNVIHAGFDSGFNSTSAFYRQFKNKTGMTPEEYQKSAQSKKVFSNALEG